MHTGGLTDTVLHALVQKAEQKLQDKEVALVLFFDVEGAFDKARASNICNTLKSRNAPVSVINWVRSAIARSGIAIEKRKVFTDILKEEGLLQNTHLITQQNYCSY